jgi:hypothetical protein
MKEGLATELLACCERCLDAYASSKVRFKTKYSTLYSPKLLSRLYVLFSKKNAFEINLKSGQRNKVE